MKLLLDENLSDRIVSQIADLFPGSLQVKEAGLFRADDSAVAEWAAEHGFAIVSKDSDFTGEALSSGSLQNSSGCGSAIAPPRKSSICLGADRK